MSLFDSASLEGETPFMIGGPSGLLEGLVYAPSPLSNKVAIICHPHPLHQGTMNNKVVYTLSRAFYNQGITAVRFNYRGVGKSEGRYGNSIGETEDLMAVISWVKSHLSHVELYLAGFSFGAYIAASGVSRTACRQLFSIAPAVTHQPYNELPSMACPWLIIQGEEDEVIAPQDVYDWYEAEKHRHEHIELIKLADTTHFFHGKLTLLRELVEKNVVQ